MGIVRIEPEDPIKEARCAGCDGDHPTRAAFVTIGLGSFGEGTSSDDRLAFGIEWRQSGMALLDSPARDRPELLGRFVPRDEALQSPDLDHLWHVADHIVLDDRRMDEIQSWLGTAP